MALLNLLLSMLKTNKETISLQTYSSTENKTYQNVF